MSLYTRIGGESAINATVDKFYDLVLQDPFLSPIFKGKEMDALRRMQKSFLNHVLGHKPYSGRSMKRAHQGLNLTHAHFDQVAKLLMESMVSLGVEKGMIDEFLAIAETTREDIIGSPKP